MTLERPSCGNRPVWDMGFDALRWLWHYFLLGAVLVIPIWFITRLLKTQGGKS